MATILKRIILGALALVLLLVLFLAGSVVVDRLAGGGRLDAVANTTLPGVGGGPDVRAYVARPPGAGPFPVVIMIHEFYGLNENIARKADGLAEEGYLVVAPDTFRGSSTAWIPTAIFQVVTTRPAQVNQDLDTVYAWLVEQPDAAPDRVGVLGFCYGGRASLAYSLHNPGLAATVIFYGAPETDPEVLAALPGPVLGIFGGADTSIPVAQVNAFETALEQAGVEHEITVYPDQPHAFLTDMESIRAGGVQGEAWAQMLAFLERTLKQGMAGDPAPGRAVYSQPFAWGYYLRLVYAHAFGSAGHSR